MKNKNRADVKNSIFLNIFKDMNYLEKLKCTTYEKDQM